MAEGTGNLELKFRLFDGSDIGPSTYSLSTTIAALKERIVAEWPQDKTIVPKAVNDVKLIYSGKVLENAKTLAESKINLGEVGGVVTMHIVVQPSITRKKAVAHLLSSLLMGKSSSLVAFSTINNCGGHLTSSDLAKTHSFVASAANGKLISSLICPLQCHQWSCLWLPSEWCCLGVALEEFGCFVGL